jgi:methyltransferase
LLTRLLVCAYMAAARLTELGISRRNISSSADATESDLSRAIYPLIVAVHAFAILGTLLFGRRRSLPWLALLLAVQPLRAWILLTLGRRWNARAAVAPDTAVETGGPYAYIRHPNYLVIIIELLALPLAFGAKRTAVLATAANAGLLALRIHEEEQALMKLPGYARHFAEKKRLIPGVI